MIQYKIAFETLTRSHGLDWLTRFGLAALMLGATCLFGFSQETEPAKPPAKPRAQTVEEAQNAAWEFRPYQVAVWLCPDGSPAITANLESIKSELVRQSELIDPSGWNLVVEEPPSRWRWAFLNSIMTPDAYTEDIPKIESLIGFDKLMAVKLSLRNGQYHCLTRELDIRTQQWGPVLENNTVRIVDLSSAIMNSLTRAFMPIARVDRVSDSDEVFMRVRAMQACLRAERTEDGGWQVQPITDSPVWINTDDRFLPVIRRTDRQGNLVRLEPIEFTFLSIEQQEGPQVICSIQSTQRAPLAGRKSKRAQKLALVIRPPDRSTTLQLIARDDDQTPLEGYEVWSGHRGAQKGEFELLGKTDWKGEIEIPPSERGMRVLYVVHGTRRLMRLPIIPGLHPRQVSPVPDDETRLYAEGIISGLQNEILNLVAQRQVYEAEIDIALKRNELKEARELLVNYQELTTPQELRNNLADEESLLRSQTSDRRELEFITTMFDTLREILNSKVVLSKEPQLRQRMQEASSGGSAVSSTPATTNDSADSEQP